MEETRKKRVIKAATAVGLSAVVLCVFGFGYLIGTTSFGSDDVYIDTDPGSNMVIGNFEENGLSISMTSYKIATEDDDSEAISTYTLEVTPKAGDVDVSTAENSLVTWSIDWTDSSEDFASKYSLDDYVTVTPGTTATTDYETDYEASHTATVVCKAAFGSQMTVTASIESANVSASCTVDYLQKVESVKLSFGDVACDFSSGKTGVTVQANECGEVSGGTPTLTVTMGSVYKIADTTTESYDIATDESYLILKVGTDNGSGTADTAYYPTYLVFAELLDGTVTFNNTLNYISSSDIATNGIYFGFPYFCENYGLNCISSGRGDYTQTEVYDTYSAADLVTIFDNIGSNIDGTVYAGGVNLFDVTLTLSSSQSDLVYTYTTTFYISDVINTAAIDGIELDPTGIVF